MLAVLPDLLVREHPDAVLLMGGTNDIAYGGDLAGARANMGAMAHLIIAGGGLPLIGIPPGLRRPIRREWAELMPERAAELLAEYQSGPSPDGERRGSFSRMASTPTPPATA